MYSKDDTGAATIEEEIIRYENVSVVFDGTTIIEHFSLPVCKGDKVILRGPSGSGKSTLLKMAQGYARPDEGTVTYRTHAIDADTAWNIRQETAYISQDTDIGEGPVRELIAGVFAYSANKAVPYQHSLNKYLTLFALDGAILDKDFRTLSGGEKQRIVIIISLLLERTIFFLD